MTRLVCLVLTALVAWLIAVAPLAVAAGEQPIPTHTYNDHDRSAVLGLGTTERGPPTQPSSQITYDAVELWSHGLSARPDTAAQSATTFDDPATLARVTPATSTTKMSAQATDRASVVPERGDVAAKSVPNPKPVLKPNGVPDRSSPWYVSYRDADGNVQTVGNSGGVHAEVRIQQMQPGAPMSKPFGWRTRDSAIGPEWVEGTVCAGCQVFPRGLFAPGTRGAPGGPWGD